MNEENKRYWISGYLGACDEISTYCQKVPAPTGPEIREWVLYRLMDIRKGLSECELQEMESRTARLYGEEFS